MQHDHNILIIDDDAHIRRVLEVKFKKLGHTVSLARNGKEALRLIEKLEPDVVISDLTMPVMDGITLCEKTVDIKKVRPFLTIIMTARISPEDQMWAESMPDTKFIEKPFSVANLVRLIQKYFGEEE